MTDTAWKEELVATQKTCHTSRDELVEKLRDSRRKVAKQIKSLGLEQNKPAENTANEKLRDIYYSNCLAAKYPVVDLSFADAKLHLLIRRETAGCVIIGSKDREAESPTERAYTVARYAKQFQPGGDRWSGGGRILDPLPTPKHILGKFLFPEYQLNREKFRAYSGEVCCNRPAGSPPSLIQKLHDIVAIGLESRAAAVRARTDPGSPVFGRMLLWKPRLEDLFITEEIQVRDDPAILVTSGDRHHLVAFWDSPDECPIEGVIREFSEGSLDDMDD